MNLGGRNANTRVVLAGLMATVLCLSGCGHGSGAGEAPPGTRSQASALPTSTFATPTETAATASAAEPATTPTSSATATATEKPSVQPTPSSGVAPATVPLSTGRRPDGLFKSEPGGRCGFDRILKPGGALTEPIPVERLEQVTICLDEYPAKAAVTAVLSDPNGRTHRYETTTEDDLKLVLTRSMSLGRWSLRATSPRSGTATATIVVSRATNPTVHQLTDHGTAGRAGMTVELAGFTRNSRVNLFLYGPSPERDLAFVRALPIATIGSDGEATYVVDADRRDPAGLYAIWLNPGPYCAEREQICASYDK